MKHLVDYINEAVEINEGAESTKVTFNFADLENAEETLKSLEGKEGVTIEDQKLTLEITKDNVEKIKEAQDILKQFCQTIRSSQKRSSDEQYAQKTKSFEDNVKKMEEAIEGINNPEEPKKEEPKKEEPKEEPKKEEHNEEK